MRINVVCFQIRIQEQTLCAIPYQYILCTVMYMDMEFVSISHRLSCWELEELCSAFFLLLPYRVAASIEAEI